MLASAAPRTVQLASGSTSAGPPAPPTASGRPWSGSPAIRAGASLHTRATPRQSSRPVLTIVATTDSAVCSPSIPGRAADHSQSFSCGACGAWSVAMRRSCRRPAPAQRLGVAPVRSGGLTLSPYRSRGRLVGEQQVVRLPRR